MPVNLSAHNELLSDSDSDTSSSEYEIVGPPSRPSSWETYIDDGYISDREYVVPTPPPHHVTRRRRSLEERELVRQEAELVARLEQCRRGGSGGVCSSISSMHAIGVMLYMRG